MSQQRSTPVTLISFAAPQDGPLLAQWEKHLLPLQQTGRITFWSEQHIPLGGRRAEQITQHLEQANIIILLLSADFFADQACYYLMERALQRFQGGRTHVIPLLLRPVSWQITPIGDLFYLPTNGRPITRWGDRDEAFQECVESISALLAQPTRASLASAPSQGPAAYYHSCFISYSSKDEALAQRLYADLKAQGVQCWFAPHDMKIGAKIRSTLDQAISQQDKLLLLLSQHSIESYWVEDEVEAALERERTEHSELLFPIRLDNAISETRQAWAAKLRRQVNIGDFSNWNDSQAYERAFERLLRDLKMGIVWKGK